MSEREIFKNLNFSKIFLSFSHLEGLGIPPIEAALLNNKVIGYTAVAVMNIGNIQFLHLSNLVI